MREALARAAYTALLRLLTPGYLARLWWRGRREPGYREHLGERLGFGEADPKGSAAARPLWIHAVSLGETRAAAALVAELRRQRPGVRLLLTHGTATGRQAGAALLGPGDAQAWLPWDTPGAVRRFLRRHRPRLGVLMETEIWPNLMAESQRAGVPLVLANARLSERSHRRGLRWPSLFLPAVRALAASLAQTEADAVRLRQCGAREVQVCGNLKFDVEPPPRLVALGQAWRERLGRTVVLAASTREGEEASLLRRWRLVPEPRPLLLIVPRHPQRFDAVVAEVATAGWACMRRSTLPEGPDAAATAADVWVGDTLGEMPLYYGMADVALLGGSFEPLCGQNLIEAAACGCPVVMGPHTFNFAEAAEQAQRAGAAVRVPDLAGGVLTALLVAGDERRNAMVRAGLDFAAAHRGAAQAMAAELLRQYDNAPG